MEPLIMLILGLLFISAFLTVAQFFAWYMLGRTPHALAWTLCFGTATVQWIANIVWSAFFPDHVVGWVLLSGLSIASGILSLIGHRLRVGLPGLARELAFACVAGMTLVALVTTVLPHRGLAVATAPLFASVVLSFTAYALLSRPESSRSPERALAIILGVFALFELIVGTIALRGGSEGDPYYFALYRQVLFLGLPALFTASGLFTILLQGFDVSAQLERVSMFDPLTDVLNRRGLDQEASRSIAGAIKKSGPVAVVVADIDHFKSINDAHGHETGDRALIQFAALLREHAGRRGIVGRLGGEEFAIMLPGYSSAAAVELTEAIRIAAPKLTIERDKIAMTASFGIAMLDASDGTLIDVIRRADEALYLSKNGGRNRITVASPADRPYQNVTPSIAAERRTLRVRATGLRAT